MNEIIDILNFFHEVEKLKLVTRQTRVSDFSRQENPAEHTWRVALMAIVLQKHLKLDIDLLKALEIIIAHDLVEIYAGDEWIITKETTRDKEEKDDRITKKRADEQKAIEKLCSLLPGKTGETVINLWLEYSDGSSTEAKFARALDKMEPMLQRAEMGAAKWERDDIDDVVINWGNKTVRDLPALKPLLDAIKHEIIAQVQSKNNATVETKS